MNLLLDPVCVDLRYCEVVHSGLTRFSVSLLQAFVRKHSKRFRLVVLLYPPRSQSAHLPDFNSFDNLFIKYSHTKRGLRWKIPFAVFEPRLYLFLRRLGVTRFVSVYIDPPFLPGIRTYATIHDLTLILVYPFTLKSAILYFRLFLTFL